ncbi:unnamed protein product (macronuclear) [Paramecium tetraurelia]|uniref:Transmembrane protein n=1 Tax=Paramecium tetraurelia TaxID=5888 RepID=A0DME3_PARTE|nr:uncharacterized protein GSPATT00018428001 [Paramecium tetraurelia]CAK84210.1 unnamed protein product [Paramecium tetraurelia]|eukprot:XP_001451607.1 hypothetical protein (macronuclear) [Paramecium tetraurelia strain d4-2]
MGLAISKNKAVVLASLGIVGFGAYYMQKDTKQKLSLEKLLSKHDLDQYLETNDRSIDQKIDMSYDIEIKYSEDHCLEASCIVDIYAKQLEMAGDDFVKLSKQNRVQRRRLRKSNQQIYVDSIVQFIIDVEDVLDQALKRLLYQLDVPKEIFEESVLVRMDQGYFQQLYMLQASVKQKIKEKIESTKKLNLKQMKDIIQFNVHILKSFPQEFHVILHRIPSENVMLVPTVINIIVQDIIYAKFGVEEEDQITSLKNIQGDQEIHNLLNKVEIEMSGLLKEQGIRLNDIPESLENFI